MTLEAFYQHLQQALEQFSGFIYPNEVEVQWGILIVLYPYVTGLVAGAFIVASLARVFNVKELDPTYRLSLLTALAFLIVAPLPLQLHLGHPERSFEILLTPKLESAMAMFGFIYLWYLVVILLPEIWFDYRKDLVIWSRGETGWRKFLHKVLTLGATDLSKGSLRFDYRFGRYITIVGIPSAFLLHGYVGFIFGSIKANPWWSSVLIPIVFLFSAIVSGIALMVLVYMVTSRLRGKAIDITVVDKLSVFLFYAIIVDVSLEMLDFIHRLYEAEESIYILTQMISSKLFVSLNVLQLGLGALVPIVLLLLFSPVVRRKGRRIITISAPMRRVVYVAAALLIQVGIFSTRWNIVIGGQLFSKSLRGLTFYETPWLGLEGMLTAIALLILPFLILWALVVILPPWPESEAEIPPVEEKAA